MGLLASNGRATGSAGYRGRRSSACPSAELNKIRGDKITMIFQEPMTSLDPLYRIGASSPSRCVHHRGLSKREARPRLELLRSSASPSPSGGSTAIRTSCPAASASA
jgi:ABC-type microcin C transport system duplicated ATPase subunit YejF